MESEKRLIDANAMREDWLENGENEYVYDTNSVLNSIDAQPTVDAVEVVRCKDCKHFDEYTRKCYVFCDNEYEVQLEVDSDHFCSCGERKDNDF